MKSISCIALSKQTEKPYGIFSYCFSVVNLWYILVTESYFFRLQWSRRCWITFPPPNGKGKLSLWHLEAPTSIRYCCLMFWVLLSESQQPLSNTNYTFPRSVHIWKSLHAVVVGTWPSTYTAAAVAIGVGENIAPSVLVNFLSALWLCQDCKRYISHSIEVSLLY